MVASRQPLLVRARLRSRSLKPALAALVVAFPLALTGCGADDGAPGASGETHEIEDNHGVQEVPVEPTSVVVTDNRVFETLSDWGVELSAAPRALMPDTIAYADDDSIVDLGNHREPDLEAVVAAEPDLIVNGQRFADYREQLADLAPGAALLDLDPREGEPFDAELKRQVTVLGEVFGKQAEAERLVADFDDAVARVQAAYDPEQSVLAVNTSGGEIGFLAPSVGRTLGPVYDFAGLTPAMELDDASDNHLGDDISVEAVAAADPDWILVMDRDAAVAASEPDYQPAADLLEGSAALQNVSAVQEGNLLFMPDDTYTNEGIQTYTEFLESFADALESAR